MAKKKKKQTAEQKKKRTRAVLAGLGAVLFLGGSGMFCVSLLKRNGWFLHHKTALETEHIQVTDAVLSIYLRQAADSYLSQYAGTMYSVFDGDLPLDAQSYSDDQTWYDVLLEATVTSTKSNLQICEAAYADGFTLSEEDKKLCADAAAEQDLSHYQKGITTEDLEKALELAMLSQRYQSECMSKLSVSDEELQAQYDSDPDSYRWMSMIEYAFQWDEGDADGEETATNLARELAATETPEAFRNYVKNYRMESLGESKADAESYVNQLSYSGQVSDFYPEIVDWAAGDISPYSTHIFKSTVSFYAQTCMLLSAPAPDDSETVDLRMLYLTPDTYGSQEEAKAFAEELLAQCEAAENPIEEFVSLVYQYSEDSESAQTGGLLAAMNRNRTEFGDTFINWAMDAGRQAGDMHVFEFQNSIGLAYFMDKSALNVWQRAAYDDVLQQKTTALGEEFRTIPVTEHERNYHFVTG